MKRGVSSACPCTFNRTSLELKQPPSCIDASIGPAFNRTSLELKPLLTAYGLPPPSLLIAPVWNWNSSKTTHRNTDALLLLIAPVWNWNVNDAIGTVRLLQSFNRTSLELKRISERNDAMTGSSTFNRTSLELKLFIEESLGFLRAELLIAPVWNWNQTTETAEIAYVIF